MIRPKFHIPAALAGIALLCGSTFGQTREVNSLFGSRTLGGTQSAGSRSAFGGPGGELGSQVEQAMQGAGELSGNERFVRGNRQGQFVGSDTGDLSTTLFGTSGGAGRGTGTGTDMSGLANLVNRNRNTGGGRTGAGRSGQNRVSYSTGLKVGFEYRLPTAPVLSNRIEERLAKSSLAQDYGPLRVTLEGRTATIRGVVATNRERVLAGHLVRMEPGISQVVNEVTLPSPSDLPPPNSTTPPVPTEPPAATTPPAPLPEEPDAAPAPPPPPLPPPTGENSAS